MKNILIIVLALSFVKVNSQTTKKVLFLGNSYTYVNNLPAIIDSLANADGNDLIFDQNTPGGYTLEEHSTNQTSLSKIKLKNWDFVVLQEQSQRPSFPPSQVETDVYPYAQILNDSILSNDSCTETLFFMTWGRKNGDQTNCQYYPPVCTYLGMQQRLRESYLQMGADNYASVAPVGIAWKRVRELTNDTIELYSSDESHPSIYGSYLAACVFYASVFNKSPVGINYYFNLPQQTALFLQTTASDVVFDSLYVWNFQTAVFDTENINNYTFEFTGTENTNTDYWDFGDGTASTAHNPSHTFPGPGAYQIKHIIQNNCLTDTFTITTDVVSSINQIPDNETELYPNPVTDFLQIKSNNFNFTDISVYDISGRELKQNCKIKYSEGIITIDVINLQKGVYFMRIGNIAKIFVKN